MRRKLLSAGMSAALLSVPAACGSKVTGTDQEDVRALSNAAGAATNVCGSVAESAPLTLTCPSGSTISAVSFAGYGTPTGACGSYAAGACNATTSLSVLDSACLGKASCTVTANNATFGDPCVGTDKRLDAQVTCSPASGSTTVCGSVAESAALKLSCPSGTTISAVSFASYGTPTGACGSYAKGTCNAATSLSVVDSACLGKTSCTVTASNATFGDPCVGTDKRLDAQVTCSPAGSSSSSSSSSSTTSSSSSSSTSSSGKTSSSSSSSSSSSTTSSSSSSSSSSSGGGGGGLFTATNPWNTAVDADPTSSSSSSIINWLASNGGWGTGSMRIDFSITLQTATASTPLETFTTTSDFYSPDCDHVPFPVPPNGALEGETGYSCTQDGDCHLLVVYPPTHKLYEMWRANFSGGTFYGGCTAVWDLTKAYPQNLRGDGCTSADAGGFPIGAMLFTADEVAAGVIPHAIRFILPNQRIRGGDVYVHPGSHTTGSTSGGANAPPYGVRFRLRPDYPVSNLSAGAQVVAKAMQKYGLFLADGGNIALTAASDQFTTHKWADVGVTSQSLTAIQVSDMQVVDMGTPVSAGSCVRNP